MLCKLVVHVFLVLNVLIDLGICNKPHIVMIVADDLGFNDVSFHGSPEIPTPNLDYLANNGIILNNYYVLPNCSPTRSAIMTGRYPIHTGMHSGTIYPSHGWGVGLDEKFLSEYLKSAGYKTHAVGKWHLGFAYKEFTPTQRGFDTFYGFYGGHGDYWDHSLSSNGYWGLDLHKDTKDSSQHVWNQWGNYSSDMLSLEAVDKINGHKEKDPMFLYLAYQAVHSANLAQHALQAPQLWLKKFQHIKHSGRRKYAAMVACMDDGVGKVYKALQKRQMLDNTIIIFTTDNGGAPNGLNMNWATNYPLRGGKTTVFEGGVKATGIVYSKFLKHPRVSHDLMHATDWLPTLMAAIGSNDYKTSKKKLDGFNLWETFRKHEPSPRNEVLINIDPLVYNNAALKIGDWKLVNQTKFYDGWYPPVGLRASLRLHRKKKKGTRFWKGKDAARIKCPRRPKVVPHCGGKGYKPCLFHIKSDPCEQNDLADTYPIIYEIMLEKLNDYRKSMVKSRRVAFKDPRSNPKMRNGVWAPWKIHPSKKNKSKSLLTWFQHFPYSLKCELRRS